MKCSHCNLTFKKEDMIEDEGRHFCCNGCRSVFKLINSNGWGDFYSLRANKSLEPVSFAEIKDYSNFIKKTSEGFSEIYLHIKNIHCSACVWLNEKVLSQSKGIIEVSVNLVNHKAYIVFDEEEISLSEILKLIASIGYKTSAYDPLKQEQKAVELKRAFYAKLVVAIACVMNIMWLAIAKYAGMFSGMSAEVKDILNFFEFILCSVVLFYTGSAFYKSAYMALKTKEINMDFLVISGATLAYTYSLYAMFARLDNVYFDSVSMIICFVFVGKYLEVLSKKHASDTMDSLNDFLNSKVLVQEGEDFVEKDVYEVKIKDKIKLSAGDKIVIDGFCISGEASIDSSSLSGESEPILVQKGEKINSACIVLDGSLIYEASSLYKDSKLSQIVYLLEKAQHSKPKIQSLVEKINVKFSRVVLFLSFICLCFWLFYKEQSFEFSLMHAISLIIISCPCALALATPISTINAIFSALKMKILVKNPNSLESLSKCSTAVFDKTGVLTKNKLKISKYKLSANLNLDELLSFVKLSKHPVSSSLKEFLEEKGAKEAKLNFKDIKELRAKGIYARSNNDEFIGGSAFFLKEYFITLEQDYKDTHFIFAKNKELLAYFEFESELENAALELINYLKSLKFRILILSGDNEKAVKKIAQKLDIKEYKASCLPEDKMKEIIKLNQSSNTFFVGDGINDALALKNSAVSISIKQGSDLAMQSSDLLLLDSSLLGVKRAIKLSKKTYRIIKQNLAFSLCYNALSISLAFLGLINPLIAAASMSFSSLVVILNSLRIRNE